MEILVVGSTGALGSGVCRHLRNSGHGVRGLVRNSSSEPAVAALHDIGVDTVRGDLTDPESLRRAGDGVDVIVSTATALGSQPPADSLTAIDRDGLTELVATSPASRLVFVSVLGLDDDSPFTSSKLAVESEITSSGREYTILQPTLFMESWLAPATGFDWASGTVTVYGEGTQPIHWVSCDDVATVVAAAAVEPSVANLTVPVLGPEAVSPLDAVATFEDVTGRSFDVSHVPAEVLVEQRDTADHPLQQSFAALMLRYAKGDGDPPAPPAQLPRPSTTVADYARAVTASP